MSAYVTMSVMKSYRVCVMACVGVRVRDGVMVCVCVRVCVMV